jgi:hypothetical protein
MSDEELILALKNVISGIRDIVAHVSDRPRDFTEHDINEEIELLQSIKGRVLK